MMEIIKDDFPFTVIMKSAQCGISEIEVARAIWRAIHRGQNVLYTMPAGEQMQQFVDARARQSIMNDDYLSSYVTGSLNLKKFELNNKQVYFRGAQKRRQIITMDVSTLEADEVDEYPDGTVNTLEKRLGAAKDPIKRLFSTPSFHGTGISLYYHGLESSSERGSDQRIWCLKCELCGVWNEGLNIEDNLIDLNRDDAKFSHYRPNVVVVCRHCRKGINRLSPNGQWVPKVTENTHHCHGYHISKLFSPRGDLNQIWLDLQNPIKEQEVYNSDLGLPYEPKGSKLTDEVIDAARGNYVLAKSSKTINCMGADIGSKIHAIATTEDENKRIKVIGIEELDDWDELQYFYKDFNIQCSVIDANPDKEEAISFQKQNENVWLAYYMQYLERTPDKIKLDWDKNTVHIHRTLMMQITSDFVYEKNLIFPLDIRRKRDFYEHLKSPIKAQKQDVRGDWITYYPKNNKPDHYYHVLLYSICSWLIRPPIPEFRIIKIV